MTDITPYTARDVDRLLVSEQAARLADRLHGLVGRHGHDVPAAGWLSDLVAPVLVEAAELQARAVRYARGRGSDWSEVAAATGVDAAEAERRWSGTASPPADPDALVTELEAWFIRLLWYDKASATVPDPVRRLLDGGPAVDRPSCLICRKYGGGPVPMWAGWASPPGGHLVDDELWRVSHAPTAFAPLGTLLVESRRHYLDYAEMTGAEAASYGTLLGALMPVLKSVTGAERVHVFSNMEGAPHFHSWLMPRRAGDVRGRPFLVDPGRCTEPEAAETVAAMRLLLEQARSSAPESAAGSSPEPSQG